MRIPSSRATVPWSRNDRGLSLRLVGFATGWKGPAPLRGREALAETEGFEPSVRDLPIRRFSKPLVSATHPRLRSKGPEAGAIAAQSRKGQRQEPDGRDF